MPPNNQHLKSFKPIDFGALRGEQVGDVSLLGYYSLNLSRPLHEGQCMPTIHPYPRYLIWTSAEEDEEPSYDM